MIGCHVSWMLRNAGHRVTVGARRPAEAESVVGEFPIVLGDYAEGGFTGAELRGFDVVIMAASQDVRHVRDGEADAAHWAKYQSDGVPDFFARAKEAGSGVPC